MDKIKEFLNKKLITNYNTKKSYRTNINKYFKLINKDINTYFEQSEEEIEKDLEIVYNKLVKKGRHLLVIRTIFNSIKQFLCKMDKRLKNLDFWDELHERLRSVSPLSEDDTPNANDIKLVLQHGNTRSRAMFLIQVSTGCRIGELLALTPNDIHLDLKPVRVDFNKTYDPSKPTRYKLFTKNNKKHYGFLTTEAKESYIAYMKERDVLFKKSIKKTIGIYRPLKLTGDQEQDKKLLDKYIKTDNRVFPISDHQARDIWARMVRKSGLYRKDTNTNRLTLHPHCLRKFYRSYLGNVDLAETTMGHSGYLSTYRDMKLEDQGKEFLKYAHNVTIFGRSTDSERLNNLQDQLKEKDKQLQNMQKTIDELKTEMLNFKIEKNSHNIEELIKKALKEK
jgi:integrase